MKTHATFGDDRCSADSAFALLEDGRASVALSHHEKWDGSGYPNGLPGTRKSRSTARIVAVADVFDALTHVRPYKAAWSRADAIAESPSHAGRHFDPQVVEAFARRFRREVRSLA